MLAGNSIGLSGDAIGISFGMYAPGCWPKGRGCDPRSHWQPPVCVSRNPNDDDDKDGIPNGEDPDWPGNGDHDGDGVKNYQDKEWLEADDDGDGYDNGVELECNTDPNGYWDRPSFSYCGGSWEHTDKNGRTTLWTTSHPTGIAPCIVKGQGLPGTAAPGGYYDNDGNFCTFSNTPPEDQHDSEPCPGVFTDIIRFLAGAILGPPSP